MMSKYLWTCLAGFLSIPLLAQEPVLPEVSAQLDTTAIVIGDQLELALRVHTHEGDTVTFPVIGETLDQLEVVKAGTPDTVLAQKKMEIVQRLSLTQFDTGAYVLKPLKFEVNGKAYYTKPHLVNVKTIAVDSLQQDFYAIKAIREVPYTFKEVLPYILAVLVLILTGGLGWYLWQKHKNREVPELDPEALLSPYERAQNRFKVLDDAKLWQQHELKEYYIQLTGVIRHYLHEEYNINALESTSDEILDSVKAIKPGHKSYNKLRDLLRDADLVKFAKSRPVDYENERYRSYASEIIEDLQPEMQKEDHEQQ